MIYRQKHLMAKCAHCQGEHDIYTAEEVIPGFACPHCYGQNKVTDIAPTTVKIEQDGEN